MKKLKLEIVKERDFMGNIVITVSREYGSGGRLIARRVAEQLNIPFYDKEIIAAVAKKTGLAEGFIREAERRPVRSFLFDLYRSAQNLSLSDQVFLAETAVIRDLAEKGSCVIVGRCADYVLREREDLLRVFVHAPLSRRCRRAAEEYGVRDVEDLEGYVSKLDKQRSSYYNYFSTSRWGDAHNYELCVNSELGVEQTAELICQAARGREGGGHG